MSFRLFIYYCALCGAWAAFVGWLLGKWLAPEAVVARAAMLGAILGLTVAFALSIVDFLGNSSLRAFLRFVAHVAVATAVGTLGGLCGGFVGQVLVQNLQWPGFVVLGWTLTGTLIGVSLGALEMLSLLREGEGLRDSLRKLRNGLVGGAVGGLCGSIFYLLLRSFLSTALRKDPDELLSSSAVGYVVLGACIGLGIGLAQVVLKQAWIKVVAGFKPGREMILTKPVTLIGKGEGCDIGLFGGLGVERAHARIRRNGAQYLLADLETPAGTQLNDSFLEGQTQLKHGDRIRVGNCVLLFQERGSS